MTMNKLTIIRQEIERLKDELPEPDIKTIVGANALRQVTLLNRLLSFINSLDEPSHIGEEETVSSSYDPSYLQSCIEKAKKSWEGVDVDEFMDEVRGREVNSYCIYGRSLEERKQSCKYCSAACAARIQDNSVVKENLTTETETDCHGLEEEIDRLWEGFAEEMEGPHNLFDVYRRCARHFAEWQKKQDQETIELAEDHAMMAGRMQMKEEMMKEYVDIGRASVINGKDGNEIFFDDFKRIVGNAFEVGDKLEIKAIKHIDKWTQQN